MQNKLIEKYHDEVFEKFGINYGLVFDLLEKYEENPDSISNEWKKYLEKLLNGDVKDESKSGNVTQKPPAMKVQVSAETASKIEEKQNDQRNLELISGVGAKIIENMDTSLSIPTATSHRNISVKLLEENRRLINQYFVRVGKKKLSFTHIVAYALVQVLKKFPELNNSFIVSGGKPYLHRKDSINLGLAVDVVRKNGSRSLMVPNIKNADKMNFFQFVNEYNNLVTKAKTGGIEPSDFLETSISLTNPGAIGTVSSNPRLMKDQGCIIAIGAIDYPAEFKAMHSTALASLGIGKVMNMTSTYDHRIIQGAQSGEFLREIDSLLLGKENFYNIMFEDLRIPQKPIEWGVDTTSVDHGFNHADEATKKQAILLQLINMFRVRGHLIANLNPLSFDIAYHKELDPTFYGFTIWDYDRQFFTATLKGLESGTLREILDLLHQTYCTNIGAEYMHIQNPDEKDWLQEMMEPVRNRPPYSDDIKLRILKKLIIAEGFEHFLHTRFIGHKRFSLEGSETLIPVLDHLLSNASEKGIEEVFFGMAHRGRLNVLSNIIGKKYEKIFSEFEDNMDPDTPQGTGDVKYHLGAAGYYETSSNSQIKVSLASNPSHLEFVNPVVEGIVRAKQTRSEDMERNKIVSVLIHGDAAFAGQGIVGETINLSQLKGYRTGGTIHIIVNNQIGFTTSAKEARSSVYATDIAKMVQAPILHVNGDDPEASIWVTKIALEYRMKFNKDIVIDLFGYRRHGHNEGDDPVYTQPLMYKKIKTHPSVKQIYEKKLIHEKVISKEKIKELDTLIYSQLDKSLEDAKNDSQIFVPDRPLAYSEEFYKSKVKTSCSLSVPMDQIEKVVRGITQFPNNFELNPKLEKQILNRSKILKDEIKIDWAFAETLAFGTLLLEGTEVRLSGQDSARGTFSQRHLVLTDMNNESDYIPLNSISEGQAKIEPLDSLLSENAVLGFEFGYSAADPLALVMWEAQFGDFANGAQVIIDNFIVNSEKKWGLPNNLVLLLPHGQEGQGPEHSSARIERFLTLCAEDNIFVTYPTTPAQYFHLLRRQICNRIEKPLIVFTPKSLLRLPAAKSELKDLTEGIFEEIIDDSSVSDKNNISTLLIATGKVYYDLVSYKEKQKIENHSIVRIEQLYPFRKEKLIKIIDSYKNLKQIYLIQEEPKNMGIWNYIYPKLMEIIVDIDIKFIGREESPSPASGSSKLHFIKQEEIIKEAFS